MKIISITIILLALVVVLAAFAQKKAKKEGTVKPSPKDISYKKDIVPIFNKYCFPCHTEDNMNPSELYLESYADIMKGGKHGSPIVSGKPDSSFLVLKI